MSQEVHITVVRVPMSRLIPHPRNPRRGNVEHIRRSLEEFGQYKPLVVQESTGHILAGNHTYVAAQELGHTHIDVHYEDIDDEKALRLALADNGTSDLGDYDIQALSDALKVSGTRIPGFDDERLKEMERALRQMTDPITDPGPQIGRAEELAKEWGTAEGQIWLVPSRTRPGKGHRLVCGDSTKPEVAERCLDGAIPKLMVTDPPYGVEYDPMWRDEATMSRKIGFGKWGKHVRPKKMVYVENDDRADWSDAWAPFPGDVAYVWHGGLHTALVQSTLIDCGFEVRAQIIWHKPIFAISRGHYSWQHEPLFYCVRSGADPAWRGKGETLTVEITAPEDGYFDAHRILSYAVKDGSTADWIGDRTQSTVWKIARAQTADGGHATQKPLECMARPIRNHDGDVYEPFAGSGTTIVASEQEGRTCYAIEIMPECMGIILERLKGCGLEPELSRS